MSASMNYAVYLPLFFSPYGRIARKPFWLALGIVAIVDVVYSAVFNPQALGVFEGILLYIVGAVAAKRLQDLGMSGWLAVAIVLPALIAGASYHVTIARNPAGEMTLWDYGLLAWFAAAVIALIAIGLLPGMRGSIAYGPDQSVRP
jgi:uncharacterized membrane protein YhaH (DUF805 family)